MIYRTLFDIKGPFPNMLWNTWEHSYYWPVCSWWYLLQLRRWHHSFRRLPKDSLRLDSRSKAFHSTDFVVSLRIGSVWQGGFCYFFHEIWKQPHGCSFMHSFAITACFEIVKEGENIDWVRPVEYCKLHLDIPPIFSVGYLFRDSVILILRLQVETIVTAVESSGRVSFYQLKILHALNSFVHIPYPVVGSALFKVTLWTIALSQMVTRVNEVLFLLDDGSEVDDLSSEGEFRCNTGFPNFFLRYPTDGCVRFFWPLQLRHVA